MTRQVLLDLVGWLLIAVAVLGGVLVSVKARQTRAAKQRKKAQRIWQATARYHEAVAAEAAEGPASDAQEPEKGVGTGPKLEE